MTINKYGAKRSSSLGVYSSTLGEGLTATQSSIESGWKWNTSSSTNLVSSGAGLSRSTQRNRLVSLSSVGIRNFSMFLLCNRPWVVNASERIMEGSLHGHVHPVHILMIVQRIQKISHFLA